MPKRAREKPTDEDGLGFGGAASSSAKAKPASKRASGRLKTLSQSFRVVDEDTRRSIQKARLDALEADNHGEEIGGGGAGVGDDDEFYVDDEGTEKKSRAGSAGSGLLPGQKGSKAASAQSMKKFTEKRARVRSLAETVAAELDLVTAAADPATGSVDLAKARAVVLRAKASGIIAADEAPPRVPAAAVGGAGGPSPAVFAATAALVADVKPARAYLLASAGPAVEPGRPHCSVCGFRGPYSCTRCGARFCTSRCGAQHKETRCLMSGAQ